MGIDEQTAHDGGAIKPVDTPSWMTEPGMLTVFLYDYWSCEFFWKERGIMTIFSFDVDADHARQNNELLKDTRRLQISAVLFAAILVGVGVWLYRLLDGVLGIVTLGVLAVLALGSLALIVIIPRYVGDAKSLYARYPLCPAMIAKINSRDMVLLSLVNVNSDPDGAPRWALAARTVSRIEGHQRRTGERVPSVAVSSMERQAPPCQSPGAQQIPR